MIIKEESRAFKWYGKTEIYERHRHRYEVNPKYIPDLEKNGMIFTAVDDTKTRMEIFEVKDHPFYIGSQFHPEFKSRPQNPSVLHKAFIENACKNKKSR